MNNQAEDMKLVVLQNNLIGTVQGLSTIDMQLGKPAISTQKQPVEQLHTQNLPYANWGDDNLAPRHYDDRIAENVALSGAIERRTDKLLAGGVEYGFLNDQGIFETKYVEEIEAFMEDPHIINYQNSAFLDYVKYKAIFPQIAFNEPKTKVLYFKHTKAPEVRWEVQNKQNGIIENAYWSKNWHWQSGISTAIKLPVIDELFHDFNYIRDNTEDYFYIYQCNIPGPNTYYQVPVWYPTVLQGWHKHSMQIPLWYEKVMERSITVPCEVILKMGYLKHVYGERWEQATTKARLDMMQERLTHIAQSIQGPENAGKFFVNLSYWDTQANEMVNGFELKPVDFKSFAGENLKNMQEADTHTMWAVGEDPLGMTNSNSSGTSGSGNKANFNGDMATNQRHANIFLAPFYFAKRFNGWDKRLKFRVKLPFLADMNQIAMDKRNNGFQDQNKPAQTDNKPAQKDANNN